jgi:hypothetical protein
VNRERERERERQTDREMIFYLDVLGIVVDNDGRLEDLLAEVALVLRGEIDAP